MIKRGIIPDVQTINTIMKLYMRLKNQMMQLIVLIFLKNII